MLPASKKGIKLAVLSLLGVFALTACDSDEVYSKPSNYDDPIISIEGNSEEIHNNLLSIIYDAMHEGSLSSKVLDEALYRYASGIFGYYNNVTRPEGSEEITLKEAAKDATHAKTKEFIKKHKAYWYYNEEGKHVQQDGTTVIEDGADWEPGDAEIGHVTAKWNAIEDRIAETMYAKISGGSYTEKNYYSEAKFLKALYEDGKSVVKYTELPAAVKDDEFIIPYTVEENEVFKAFKGYDYVEANDNKHQIMHREYYQSSESEDPNAPEATFIEDEVVPSVYNDLLIEQYLLDEDVAAVRNSRGRKINVLKIEKYSSFTNNADMLVKSLVNEIYNSAAGDYLLTDKDEIEAAGDALFEKYALLSKGLYDQIQGNAQALAIVNAMHSQASDLFEEAKAFEGQANEFTYYKNTTAGDLAEDYEKVASVTNWDLLDSSKYSSFTSSGTRSVEEGYEQQLIDIMQAKNITKGWYIQSKTASLDSNGEINNRLFKLSIANAKIELNSHEDENYADLVAADRLYKDGADWKVKDKASDTENRFLCSINGMYFLKFDGKSADDSWTNDIVYDDGSAYYIVQVLEAAKDSKLRNVSNTNYAHTRGQAFMDQVIDEIAKIVGETGSYSTLSKNHWLEKMDLNYFDQEVYDYFKSNYPDLFEDD